MSYNVTITANSLEELADKALALGGRLTLTSLRPTATVPAAPEAVYTPPAEIAEINPVAAAKPAKVKTAPPPAPEPVSEPVADIPDYDTIVGPAVLALVDAKGKPVTKALLASYNGATKADQVPPAQWAQLVADLNAARLA